MLLVKNSEGVTTTMTEKEYKDAQRLLSQYKWEIIKEIEENQPVDDFNIQIIEPNKQSVEDKKALEKTYPRGWNRRKEFIAPNGDVYHKGVLQ